jgi:hypothetical protein
MSDNLRNIAFAIYIGRHARMLIWQNLSIALSVIVVLVRSALGFPLPLPVGVVGHEGSTVLACLNGLRFLAFRADGSSTNRDICAGRTHGNAVKQPAHHVKRAQQVCKHSRRDTLKVSLR